MSTITLIITILVLAETTLLTLSTYKKLRLTGKGRRKIFIDTSVLMDGRILAIARTGFLGDEFIIPRSVLRELQLLADSSDGEKRTRARLGLDTVNELERVIPFDVKTLVDKLDRTPVDERLLSLAKENKGVILTLDFNLNKRAAAEHITVLNINALSQSLQNEFDVGDTLEIKITGKGNGRAQGVGYTENGTMVVVDRADRKVGNKVKIKVERFLQTDSGKMIFAKLTTK
jgi:uncharacterized protein YacL